MSISYLLVEHINDEYNQRRLSRYFSRETLDKRLDTCANCDKFDYNHCTKIGCSVYRFRQIVLAETPMCPEGKHNEIPPST